MPISPPNANYAPETCARCQGSGKDPRKDSDGLLQRCGSCYGKGSVLVAQPSRQCATCGGTGIDPADMNDDPWCLPCHSTGWVHRWVVSES